MRKWSIFLASIFLISAFPISCLADVRLVSPEDKSILDNRIVTFIWENTDQEHEYTYQIKYKFGNIPHWDQVERLTNPTYTVACLSRVPIRWKILYCNKTDSLCTPQDFMETPEYTFSIGSISQIPDVPTETKTEVEPESEIAERNNNSSENRNDVPQIPRITKKKTSLPPEPIKNTFDWNVSTTTNTPVVMGASDTSKCKFKYTKGHKAAQLIGCSLPHAYITGSKELGTILEVEGSFPNRVDIDVDLYKCEHILSKPQTWFRCNEKFLNTQAVTIFPHFSANIIAHNKDIPIKSFDVENDIFHLITNEHESAFSYSFQYEYHGENAKYKIAFNGGGSISINPLHQEINSTKPFDFPLNKNASVTQWHGNTAYQKPHTGIDFGVTKENIFAVSDGNVVAKGWDSYNGECNSGGNYLVIKQSNGMYTAYFHLQEIYVDVGKRVTTHTILGISGNTGSWNCQPLAYHLHFETRIKRTQTSHVNPVDYVNIDWNTVLTLGIKSYPGRLSGDNPHPGK